ncbi:terminal uridylyl transferase 1, U6 snRNA-specific [Nesidiocoris tenuis]|uniref:Terminal uridylyl transferase 1, U6 snRNA-specific n=1 Tax=Nesidiocoris tenuis TaxID=355587 RepID=A0ABN7B8Y9_9HEMI|nr:terminal uridylyl transferase 1, U6 snRNA-specific [Nesidiocoris tenuis]
MHPNRPRFVTPMNNRYGQFTPRAGLRPRNLAWHYRNRPPHRGPFNPGQNYDHSRFEPYGNPVANRDTQNRKTAKGTGAIQNSLTAGSSGVELEKRPKNEDPTTFEYQASVLLEKLELTPDRKRQIQAVLNDVVSIWYQLMPDVRTVVYGSLSNGLATKYSDIDCFIDSDSVPDGAERMKLMLDRWRWMFRGGAFHDVIPIRNARVPIIKAVHSTTGIPIDLSCTSDSALRNTSLIHNLVDSDSRFRPLVLLVLSFYRERDLAGSFKFVSYAITLMVTFYLQNVEPPILPPLSKILSSPSADEWPCRLCGSAAQHVDRRNGMTLRELYAGFFKFYAEMDLEKSIMSPYCSKILAEEMFKNPNLLPDEFVLLKNLCASGRDIPLLKYTFRLQDPILHDATPATTVTKKILALFRLENRRYLREVIEKRPPDRWLVEMSNLPHIVVPKVTNQKSVNIAINWRQDEGWLDDFIACLSAAFEFLLFDVNSADADDGTLAIFDVFSSYDVFNKRFRGRFSEVIKQPETLPAVRKYFDEVKNNMKKPESSFCARVVVTPATAVNLLKIKVLDTNKNVKNTFEHIADRLVIYLEQLLTAVKCYREKLPSQTEQTDS